jgi:hypothetical protein
MVYVCIYWQVYPINSKWRNPFPINKKTPDQEKERRRVLIEFKEYLTNQPMLSKQIPELKDKVLGCWCKPLPCHGYVLAELADKY